MLLKDGGGESKSVRLMLDPFCVPIDVLIAENYPRRVKRGVSVGRSNICILESKTDANLFIRQAVIFVAWDGRPLDFSVKSLWGRVIDYILDSQAFISSSS